VQALWSDPDRIEGPGRSTDEPRFQVVGQIGETTWTATVTYRHEETIRIVSVRRARTDEKEQYEDGSGEVQRVNVDFPVDLLRSIDREARRIGVTRQAFIKLRMSDTLPNT
jgi:uncharacterized DUF497 family protein